MLLITLKSPRETRRPFSSFSQKVKARVDAGRPCVESKQAGLGGGGLNTAPQGTLGAPRGPPRVIPTTLSHTRPRPRCGPPSCQGHPNQASLPPPPFTPTRGVTQTPKYQALTAEPAAKSKSLTVRVSRRAAAPGRERHRCLPPAGHVWTRSAGASAGWGPREHEAGGAPRCPLGGGELPPEGNTPHLLSRPLPLAAPGTHGLCLPP